MKKYLGSSSDFPKLWLLFLGIFGSAFAYGQSLCLGLISEDWIHVFFAKLGADGNLTYLVQNFTGPWLQTSRIGYFYRPAIEFSFLLEAILSKHFHALTQSSQSQTPSWLFHLSNCLIHALTSYMVGKLAFQLVVWTQAKKPRVAAMIATSLFAVNPLAQETVVWITCRCDGLMALFSLLSISKYIDYLRTTRGRYLSLAYFILALLCKETALILPVVLFFLFAFAPNSHKLPFKQSFLIQFFATDLIFALIRSHLLGYKSSYTVSTLSFPHALFDSISYILFPFNHARYPDSSLLALPIAAYYLLAVVLLKEARQRFRLQLRLNLLALTAAFLTLTPALQVFKVLPNLFGTRFLYLPMAFLFSLFGVMVSGVEKRSLASKTLCMVLLSATICWLNLIPFKELDLIQSRLITYCEPFLNGRVEAYRLCILNIPFNTRSEALLADIWQTRVALSKANLESFYSSNNVITSISCRPYQDLFDPTKVWRQIRKARTQLLVVNPGEENPFLSPNVSIARDWIDTSTEKLLLPINLAKQINHRISYIPIPSQSKVANKFRECEWIEIDIRKEGSRPQARKIVYAFPRYNNLPAERFTLAWETELTKPIFPGPCLSAEHPSQLNADLITYRFPVADKVSFRLASNLRSLNLLGLEPNWKIERIELCRNHLIPRISPVISLPIEEKDTYSSVETDELEDILVTSGKIEFQIDEEINREISHYRVEVGKVDQTFADQDEALITAKPTESLTTKFETKSRRFSVDTANLQDQGLYQLRVIALDGNGNDVGFYSFPETVIYRKAGFQKHNYKTSAVDRLRFEMKPGI